MEKNKSKPSSSKTIKNIAEIPEKEGEENSIKEEKNKEEEEEEQDNNIIIQQFGQNPHLVQIIKGNYYYLLNRDNFDISKIMMLIDYHKLSVLGDSFLSYESPDGEDGVLKIDFIKMAFELLKDQINENEKTDLVYGLHRFFSEIDFNGDGHMEWAEFTQFIIDKVEGEFSLPKKEDEKEKEKEKKMEKDLTRFKRYELSQNIHDYNIHREDINTASYMNNSNKLLISEYNSHIIKVYNPLNGKIENLLDIQKINYDIEKDKINDILRNQKQPKKVKKSSKIFLEVKSDKKDTLSKILGKNYLKKKLQDQHGLNKSFTIISFTVFNSVIAVLLSNNKIQFFTTVNSIKGDLLFEIKTNSLQKRIWYLSLHNKWFSSGDKEPREKYYYINELDIDFQLKEGFPVPISNNLVYKKRYCQICEHKNEIYDVIETEKPFYILTACLDGLIRLIDANDSEFIKTWNYHYLGVKHLDYNPYLEINGYIISTGFENYINILNTDISLDEAYKGRLEGHYAPIINCRFICDTPICVSLDEEGNLKIWEILQRACLQTILVSKKNFCPTGLLMMNKINKFIVFGKIILFYDSKYRFQKVKKNAVSDISVDEINHPIKIGFNKYYQNFYVITLKDIRIFNQNGELEKLFRKCVENENFEFGVKIRNFIFETHYRKFYLSFSNGAVMQYNAGNGSLIKPINQYEIEKEGIVSFKYSHSKDASSLYFFNEEKESEKDNYLLLTASLDSTIQVFNEFDLQTTTKLRTIKGGHTLGEKKCEILCLDFSDNLCQFATGGTDGLISLWDFQFSKMQDILYFNYKYWGVRLDVLIVKYLNDYPLLFSSYSEGICALWGIYPLNKTPILILKFHNFYQTLTKLDFCDVLCCFFSEGNFEDYKQNFIYKKYFVDTPENIEERKKPRFDPITGEELPLIKREDIEKESITDNSLDPIIFEEMLHNQYDMETLKQVMKANPRDYEKKFLIICDKKGFLRLLDLTGIFGKYKSRLSHPENFHVIGSNFNLLKKDDINAESFLSHLIRVSDNQQKIYYKQSYNNIYATNIIKKEWRGHLDAITGIDFSEEPISIITVAKDMHLRIWDKKLELIGEIDIFSNEKHKFTKQKLCPWKFKVDEKAILEKEINEIVEALEYVGIKPFKFGSKQDEENNKLKVVEIKEIPKKVKKTEKSEIKTERRKKEKVKEYDTTNKSDYATRFETLYLKNLTKNIDNLFENNGENKGFGEISNNIIKTIISHKEKEKMFARKKNKEKKNSLLGSLTFKYRVNKPNKKNTLNNKLRSQTTSQIIYPENDNDNKSVNFENENLEKDKTLSCKRNKSKYGSTFTPARLGSLILKLNKNEFNKKDNSKYNSMNNSEMNSEINKELNIQDNSNTNRLMGLTDTFRNKIKINKCQEEYSKKVIFNRMKKISNRFSKVNSNNVLKLKRNLSSEQIQKNGFKNFSKINKRPKSGLENNMIALNHIPVNIDRTSLYSEKLFLSSSTFLSKTKRKFFPSIKKKLEEAYKNNQLNYNMIEKTEDLVKNQFYLNSYKNCCKIIPSTSLSTNASIMMNYKNMWNSVKNYTNNLITKRNERTKTNFTQRSKMVRSRSALDLKNKY